MILDVGSGHNPLQQADVLCDLFVGPTPHRVFFAHLEAKRDSRPFVCCDAQYLPFRTGTFEWVYSSHVIEHLPDPPLAIHEFKRVGRHGMITFPSGLSAHFSRTPCHLWIIDSNGSHKSLNTPIRRLLQGILRRNFRIRLIEQLIRILKYNPKEETVISW